MIFFKFSAISHLQSELSVELTTEMFRSFVEFGDMVVHKTSKKLFYSFETDQSTWPSRIYLKRFSHVKQVKSTIGTMPGKRILLITSQWTRWKTNHISLSSSLFFFDEFGCFLHTYRCWLEITTRSILSTMNRTNLFILRRTDFLPISTFDIDRRTKDIQCFLVVIHCPLRVTLTLDIRFSSIEKTTWRSLFRFLRVNWDYWNDLWTVSETERTSFDDQRRMFVCRQDSIVSLFKSARSVEKWRTRIENRCAHDEVTDKACHRRHQTPLDRIAQHSRSIFFFNMNIDLFESILHSEQRPTICCDPLCLIVVFVVVEKMIEREETIGSCRISSSSLSSSLLSVCLRECSSSLRSSFDTEKEVTNDFLGWISLVSSSCWTSVSIRWEYLSRELRQIDDDEKKAIRTRDVIVVFFSRKDKLNDFLFLAKSSPVVLLI